MPYHPTSFENYSRYREYLRRIRGGEPPLTEEGSDLGADFFRPALPGPFNYTPAEFATHPLQVDPLPNYSFVQDYYFPRNLLDIPEEFGAYSGSAETAAATAGSEAAVLGPEAIIPASAGAYLYATVPGARRATFETALNTATFGLYGTVKAGEEIFDSFTSHPGHAPVAAQTPPRPAGRTSETDFGPNHGNTYK